MSNNGTVKHLKDILPTNIGEKKFATLCFVTGGFAQSIELHQEEERAMQVGMAEFLAAKMGEAAVLAVSEILNNMESDPSRVAEVLDAIDTLFTKTEALITSASNTIDIEQMGEAAVAVIRAQGLNPNDFDLVRKIAAGEEVTEKDFDEMFLEITERKKGAA